MFNGRMHLDERRSDPSGRIRVLVVDDEPAVLETVGAILEEDFHVQTCPDPVTALSALESEDFDVLCTDQQMPGMTGLQLIEHAAALPNAPIAILMTGRARAYYAAIAESSATPLSMLIKPCDPVRLLDSVNHAATFVRMRRALRTMGSGTDA